MAKANEKPDKTHDRLMKELNKLKTDLNNEGNMDTDLTRRHLRSRMLVVPTPKVLSPSQMATVDTTEPHSNTPQIEQDTSSPRFNFSENKGSLNDVKGHRARNTKVTRLIKKQAPLFNPLELVNINWKLKKKKQFQRLKSKNQYFDTPKNQD